MEIRNASRTPAEVFSEIYATNAWGGRPGEICSGSGSSGLAAEIYVKTVNEFVRANQIRSVLDLGCGDYSVGRQIVCERYIGVDVVDAVIARNVAEFGRDDRQFLCRDIAGEESLPHAELCLIRQVLQHLSNDQIMNILRKINAFDWVIVTEHQPSPEDFRAANLDKVHGAGTRLYSGSGVYLDRPPFGLNVQMLFEVRDVGAADDVHGRGPIRSFLLRPQARAA